MIHPLSSRGHWYGVEVEGALSGLPTVFFAELPDDFESVLHGAKAAFVCEWCRPPAAQLEALAQRLPTTIACYPHEVELLVRCVPSARLMVRVCMTASWVHLLRPEDEVTVGEPFNLLTWRVLDAVRTTPEQYCEDHA